MDTPVLSRISIVISVYNCDNLVKRCIDSLIACLDGALPELIITDNANSSETRALIDSYALFGVQYYPMPKDLGFAGANNVGVAHTTKEFVCLVNSDTVFHNNPFVSLIDFMDQHPKAMVAQGTVTLENGIPGENGKLDTCGAGITATGRITNPADKKDPSDPSFLHPRKVFYAYGALFLFRRNAIENAGGFLFRDEFYAYYEETDFCHRIWLGGNEVWYVPTPIVGHAHTATFKKQYNSSRLLLFTTSNRRCSFLSCFGIHALLTIFLRSEASAFLLALNHLCHGRTSCLKNYIHGWLRSVRMLPATFRRRRAIQRLRVVTDKQIVSALFDPFTLSDFIKEIRGMT